MAIEQLRIARMKRTKSTHVVLCPKLLTPRWRRLLYKVADLVCEYPVGKPFWEFNMHEPLTITFCFPFIRHKPRQLRQSPALLGVGRMLQRMWKSEEGDQGPLLQKICIST